MGAPLLRDYQDSLVSRTRSALQSGRRAPLLVSPTGSGKTVLFCFFAARVAERGKRVLIMAHREELLDQISDTLASFQVPHSFVAPGRPFNPKAKVQVGSVFSVARRLDKIGPVDIFVLDEAHHAIAASTWGKVIKAFPQAWRIGVTATPARLSGEPLSDLFDDLILGPTVAELIAMGHLCPYKIFAPSTIDTAGLRMRGGDFSRGDLSAIVMGKPTITGDAIREYVSRASGKRAVAFCASVEHAKQVAADFRGAGFQALSLDGKMDRSVRRGIVSDFREGRLQVIASCDIISEGFDLPAIEVAIMLRPTQSLVLWLQQVGRALRPFPGKDHALILDHAGNTARHGLPDDEREWTLSGRIKKPKEAQLAVRTCPKCFAVVRPGPRECSYCGYVFEVASREIAEVDGELVEVDPELLRRQRKQQQAGAGSLEDLIQLGKTRGYRSPERWARHVWESRQRKVMGGR